MILELIYCCCVMCTDVRVSCASQEEIQSLGWDRFLTWAWGFHYELVAGQTLIKKRQQSSLFGHMLWQNIWRVKAKQSWMGQGRHPLGWELLSSGSNRARAQCALCSSLFPVPTRASWEGNCLQSPCSCVWNHIALQAMNASCFSSWMVN